MKLFFMTVKFQISNNDNIRYKYFSADEAFSVARYKLVLSFKVHHRDTGLLISL